MPGFIMNGTRARQRSVSSSSEPRYGARLHGVPPGAKVLVDGYNGSFEGVNSEFQQYDVVSYSELFCIGGTDSGQMNRQDPQRSPLLNMDDPVAMHLLMETAIGDSQQYQILPYEEVDATKRELSILSTRIDGTKRKLVLETKLRDAAQSLNRLQDPTLSDLSESSPKSGRRHRRSLMGSRGSLSDMLNKSDDEMAVSTRKCEELAQELWQLEKRAEALQTKLLEHTAGVLQKTHKGYLEKDSPMAKPDGFNGHFNGQNLPSTLDLSQEFDDRSFYQMLDSVLDSHEARLDTAGGPSREDFAHYNQAISATESRLEDFNSRLREAIAQVSSQNHTEAVPPVQGIEHGQHPASVLDDQLNYLEKSFEAFQKSQNAALQKHARSLHAAEEQCRDLSNQLRNIITRDNPSQTEYPSPPGDLNSQIGYLKAGLDAIKHSFQDLTEDNRTLSSKIASVDEGNRYRTVLLGLWEILIGGEEDLRRQDPVQREVLHEEFSLELFSNKVQTLFARATGLQEQKDILTRQVQQQRELNTQSDSTKDAKVSEMTIELEQARKLVAEKEREAKEARDDLIAMTERVDIIKQETSLLEQEKGMNDNNVLAVEKEARQQNEERFLAELSEKQNQLAQLESELAETKDDFGIANAEMLGRLEESERRIQSLSSDLKDSRAELDKSRNDMQEVEGQLAHLQTELTVAKAELDGVYGTRAQRAAEATTNPVKQYEFDDLSARNKRLTEELESLRSGNNEMSQRMQTLQKELTETIGEYETMTQSTITFEREREELENNLDTLSDRCESLETQLSEEKVRWLGVKGPGSGGARDSMSPGTTSTQVLKNEFKKMMRDTRAESMRVLRVTYPLLSYV